MLPEGYPAGEIVGQDGRAHAEGHSADDEEGDDAAEEPVVVAHCGQWSAELRSGGGLGLRTDPDTADVEPALPSASSRAT